MFTPPCTEEPSWPDRRVTNAPYRARETRAALPMAKPFPTAAVVLPAASRASVFSRTFFPPSKFGKIGGESVSQELDSDNR